VIANDAPRTIRFGHSPDADDAFMFFGLATGRAAIPGWRVDHVMEDIQRLNERAIAQGDLEVTAISAAIYPRVAHRYRIMSTGASMGRGYGPLLVSRYFDRPAQQPGHRIAIPGEFTTAYLLLRLFLGSDADIVDLVPMHFERIMQAVADEEVEAGLLIHEGQLTHGALGLRPLVDLGRWWDEETGLPLPLGLDVVRADLGDELCRAINRALRASIEAAYADEDAALDYALGFGRGVERETCRRFVKMYVNEDTIDMGDQGARALGELYGRAHRAGFLDAPPTLDIVR
jgi:1,4-dihydroxy-6-naphthoate synthase